MSLPLLEHPRCVIVAANNQNYLSIDGLAQEYLLCSWGGHYFRTFHCVPVHLFRQPVSEKNIHCITCMRHYSRDVENRCSYHNFVFCSLYNPGQIN